jgi:hypothetical protein
MHASQWREDEAVAEVELTLFSAGEDKTHLDSQTDFSAGN